MCSQHNTAAITEVTDKIFVVMCGSMNGIQYWPSRAVMLAFLILIVFIFLRSSTSLIMSVTNHLANKFEIPEGPGVTTDLPIDNIANIKMHIDWSR